MAHTEKKFVLNNLDSREALHELYLFYRDDGGPVTIVDDGGTLAVSLDGTTPAGAVPSVYTDWAVGGYFVIEGAHANGGTWQAQIRYGTSDDLEIASSARGGWSNANLFTLVTTTVKSLIRWNDGGAPSAGTTLWVVSSDVPEFATDKALVATYCLLVQSGNTLSEGYAVGGLYIPLGQGSSTDDHPWGVLAGVPSLLTSTTNWGNTAASAQGAGGSEGAHTTAAHTPAGLKGLDGTTSLSATDYDGRQSQPPLWFQSANHRYGVVPAEFMTHVNNSIPDGQPYPAGDYVKFNQIAYKLTL